jgi:hypothetical protein
MSLLEAWNQSRVNTARLQYGDITITVNCIRIDFVTVFIGGIERKLTPDDFSDLCRILGINPEKGWEAV